MDETAVDVRRVFDVVYSVYVGIRCDDFGKTLEGLDALSLRNRTQVV